MIHQGKKHHQGGKIFVLILEKANIKVLWMRLTWVLYSPHRK